MSLNPVGEPGDVALRLALRTMATDREWRIRLKAAAGRLTGTEHRTLTSIMLPKLTFYGLAPDVMRRGVATAEKTFSVH